MTIEQQNEIIRKATELYYDWMKLANSTWNHEEDKATPQWHILQHGTNCLNQAIKHLNDIHPIGFEE